MATMGERIKARREALGLSQPQLAEQAGVRQQTIHQLETIPHRRSRFIVAIAAALGVRPQWLETGRPPQSPEGVAEPSTVDPRRVRTEGLYGPEDLPVYGTAEGGPDGMLLSYEVIERVRRPGPLLNVAGAFAMYVVGDSMSPRFEPGEMLLIHPTKPPRRGDDVLIIRANHGEAHSALVKRFQRWEGDELVVEQFNPAATLRLPRAEIYGIHLVVGHHRR